jgi:hypothetical protein
MLSQEVTVELLLGDGSNYKSWSISIYNAFMHVDPDLRQIFSRSIFPSNFSQNPSDDELRCLSLNHHACNILVDSLSRSAYFAIMSSDSDLFVNAHDLWTKIKLKFFKSIYTASAPPIACDTNLSKGEEQKRWQPNDESTSPKGSSSSSYKCLIANNDSGDESNNEEEYVDDSEDETSSPQGTFSCIASTDNNDRENETYDVEEEKIRRFYTHLNKEDKALLVKLLRRNKEQGETLLRLEETLIKTNDSLEKMTKEHEELKCSRDDLVQRYDSVLIEQRNNDDTLSCVAQLKMENAMLERQVEVLSHDKLALTEKYDLLSCYHDNIMDRHIMLEVAHKVVIANLNSCEPHSCTRAHLDNISSCANPGYSKESQLLDEHQAAGSKVSAFRPRGLPGPTSKLSLRVPAQMGRRETETQGGENSEGKPAASCCPAPRADALAVGGYKRSRGRERDRGRQAARSPARPPPSYESPGPSFYRRKERVQVYNGGCSSVLTCLAERS